MTDLQVIIVEDDGPKYGKLYDVLVRHGVREQRISRASCMAEASRYVAATRFDLMLLDVNIPARNGEPPRRGGGLELLRQIARDETCHKPTYVVGITAYDDVIEEFGTKFEDELWSLIQYNETSDRWVSQLGAKLSYIAASQTSRRFSDGCTFGYDVAVVCALDTVEFAEVRKLPCDWQPLKLKHDETRYLTGVLQTPQGPKSILAAAALRMGMSASSVLASKVIQQFRPRILAMVGICAGREEKVRLGDIIAADPTWDWGSGKILGDGKQTVFQPSPHQLDNEGNVVSVLKEASEDRAALALLKSRASGKAPPFELNVHVGPLVSGAAVVSDERVFGALLAQHRGILGIDMEAYGIFAAAAGNGKPRPIPLVLKGVSDYADKKKDDDYQVYAASISASFLLSVVPGLLDT